MNERVVKKLVNHNEYVTIPFKEIKKGDIFILHAAYGTELGRFVASSNAYLNKDNIWTVAHKDTNGK
jgi:hypothetical protein